MRIGILATRAKRREAGDTVGGWRFVVRGHLHYSLATGHWPPFQNSLVRRGARCAQRLIPANRSSAAQIHNVLTSRVSS